VAVEFGLDEWDHVDAVDAQVALATEEPRCIDVRPLHVNRAHHDAGEFSPDEAGTTQVRIDELRSLQVVGPGEGCHDVSLSKGAPVDRRFDRYPPDAALVSQANFRS